MTRTLAFLPGSAGRPTEWPARSCAIGGALLALAALAIATAPAARLADAEFAVVLLHVPAAWLSLLLFAAAAGCAALTLAQRDARCAQLLQSLALVGVPASLVALWTGLAAQRALGAWWGPDPRLVCELVLLLLYAGVIVARAVIADPARADRAAAVLALVGALNIPAIYFPVNWWHSLHEGAAAGVVRSPFAVTAMVVMTLAFCLCAAAVVLARLQSGVPKEQQ